MLKKFYMALITILCSLGITIAISYAWFLNDTNVDPIAQGMAGTAYFAYGDGSSDKKAYGINSPRHLYNLAWLSYLYPDQYANKYYEIDPSLKVSLNMDGWTLPPIGKDNLPFTGFFNGNGKTIEKLTVSNDISSMRVKPNADSIPDAELNGTMLKNATSIGFFGNISGDGTTQVHDFYLDNAKIETKASSTCAGIVAGYVDGKIENVGVISSGLDLGNTAHSATHGSNVSDYTVVGYATEKYTTTVANSKTVVYNATTSFSHFNYRGMGEQTAWGGSMDMQKLYNRIKTSTNSGTEKPSYTIAEVRRYTNDDTYTVTNTQTGTGSNYKLKEWGGINGSYLKDYVSNTNEAFQSLGALYKDVYSIRMHGSEKKGYKIHDGNNHFLSYDKDNDEYTTVTSANDATIWLFDETNHNIYTYDDEEFSADIIRFLNGTTDLVTTLGTTSTTNWYWDDTIGTFKYNYDGKDYYLNCVHEVNGVFKFKMASNYVITDGSGNYMKRNGSSIDNVTNVNDATKWVFSNNGTNLLGVISDVTDSTMKLNISGISLVAGSTNTSWNYDGTNIFSGSNVIKFNGANWVIETQNTVKIRYNGHYLLYNGSLSDTTTPSDGTDFTLSGTLKDATGNGKISFNYNNKTYYLRYNNGLTTTQTQDDSNTTWYKDQYGIYITSNNTKLYIQYSNGWKVQESSTINLSRYYIAYTTHAILGNTTNYLTRNGLSITNQTSANDNALWIFSQSGNNPSGAIYQIVDNTYYYLNLDSSGPIISTTTAHTFSNSNGYLYDETSGYYLVPNVSGRFGFESFNGWTTSTSRPSKYPAYTTGANLSVDDYEHTPFASFGVYTGYISRADVTSINLNSTTGATYDLVSTKSKAPEKYNYIPINAADSTPYNVAENNTGYIMSGGYEGESGTDIRVSQFTKNKNVGWGIGGSYSDNAFIANKIYTVGANGVGIIKDSAGSTSGVVYDNTSATNPLFTKFEDSKSQLQTTLKSSGDHVYGLHFMDAQISKNHVVTPTKVKINGEEKPNYQMPEDCIDFTLKSKGFINFFSGYYYSTRTNDYYYGIRNDAFFSLHEIIRDSSGKITQIRHILQVYKRKLDNTLVYHYEDIDNPSETGYYYYNPEYDGVKNLAKYITVASVSTSEYDLMFDKNWIEDPEGNWTSNHIVWQTHRNCVFYFEIPVNKGEYALGSVKNKNGTYLIYLDIGANASIVDRTQITQETSHTEAKYVYPNGIQILSAQLSENETFDVKNSFVAIVPVGTQGQVNVSMTNDSSGQISQALNMSYSGDGIIVTNGTVVPHQRDGTTHNLTTTGATNNTTTKTLKFIDFNNGTNKLYYVTVTKVGAKTATYDVYRISGSTETLITDTTSTNAEYGLLIPGTGTNAGYGVAPTSAENLITSDSITFRNTENDKILEYKFDLPGNYFNIEESYKMTIGKITTAYTINSKNILSGTDKYQDGNYYLQHVYRMTGNTITVAITAPSGATTTDYDSTIKISVYEPNKVEATGDTAPGYIFTINGTPISSTNTTIDVTATAAS